MGSGKREACAAGTSGGRPLRGKENIMDIRINDILVMKKPHPCGEKRWLVLRTGADFRLRCMGCGHEVMTPRFKAEKNIRTIEHSNPSD